MSTVGTGSQKFSHGEKAQLGTPADCLDFPSHFLLDVVSTVSLFLSESGYSSRGCWMFTEHDLGLFGCLFVTCYSFSSFCLWCA